MLHTMLLVYLWVSGGRGRGKYLLFETSEKDSFDSTCDCNCGAVELAYFIQYIPNHALRSVTRYMQRF